MKFRGDMVHEFTVTLLGDSKNNMDHVLSGNVRSMLNQAEEEGLIDLVAMPAPIAIVIQRIHGLNEPEGCYKFQLYRPNGECHEDG